MSKHLFLQYIHLSPLNNNLFPIAGFITLIHLIEMLLMIF